MMLIRMVNGLGSKRNWCGYSWLDDMKADALVTLCQNYCKFDENKTTNAFAYLTQIIRFSFITFLEKETKQRDIKDAIWESLGLLPSFARQVAQAELDATVWPVASEAGVPEE
jgi:DNA-directed RNA polymerase specialized sigma24 family protein